MTATGLLFILVGAFIVLNAGNFVGVIQGNKSFGFNHPSTPSGGVSTPATGGGNTSAGSGGVKLS